MVGTINKYKPNLFIELAEPKISRKIVEFLISRRYSIYDIVSNNFA